MVGLPWQTWARLVVWLVIGMALYFGLRPSPCAQRRIVLAEFLTPGPA